VEGNLDGGRETRRLKKRDFSANLRKPGSCRGENEPGYSPQSRAGIPRAGKSLRTRETEILEIKCPNISVSGRGRKKGDKGGKGTISEGGEEKTEEDKAGGGGT